MQQQDLFATGTTEQPDIERLIRRGATFVINHSGGKDSQIMTIKLRKIIPDDQLIVIHAGLPGVDWPGLMEHINETTWGLRVHYCEAKKTFFEMVRHRGEWPSPKYRQCTSDLKRGPIEKEIRNAISLGSASTLIVNCVGIRAEESRNRAKANPWKFCRRNSKAGREWYDWLPIFEMSESDVFLGIEEAGEKPHWAYGLGMSRLSCCFCIMSNKSDLRIAAKAQPELYERILQLEQEIDRTFMMPSGGVRKFLPEYIGEDHGTTDTDRSRAA